MSEGAVDRLQHVPQAQGPQGGAFRSLGGIWAMTSSRGRTFHYEWFHWHAETFTGVLYGYGAIQDGYIEPDGSLQWLAARKLWRGHVAETADTISGRVYQVDGQLVGTFSGCRLQVRKPAEPTEDDDVGSRSRFQDWADGLFFSLDRDGKEQLLDADGTQVMMEWERPYMVQCVDALGITPTSDVLEVGFGCGYSAEMIQAAGPRSHTIIECSEAVLTRLRLWASSRPNVHIVEGTWQQQLPNLGRFDRMFFDDYGEPGRSDAEMRNCPNEQYRRMYLEAPSHFHAFLNIALRWHARKGAKVSGYLVSPIEVDSENCQVYYRRVPVAPPPHCDYFFSDRAIVPLFVKNDMTSAKNDLKRCERGRSLSSTRSSSGSRRPGPRSSQPAGWMAYPEQSRSRSRDRGSLTSMEYPAVC